MSYSQPRPYLVKMITQILEDGISQDDSLLDPEKYQERQSLTANRLARLIEGPTPMSGRIDEDYISLQLIHIQQDNALGEDERAHAREFYLFVDFIEALAHNTPDHSDIPVLAKHILEALEISVDRPLRPSMVC
ncbi:MAG: hypothetical protein QUS07_07165 [Methanothrix sp.]|nr:hypothetical protein [Methanothrix sp.]